jgi:hypothetical protein
MTPLWSILGGGAEAATIAERARRGESRGMHRMR